MSPLGSPSHTPRGVDRTRAQDQAHRAREREVFKYLPPWAAGVDALPNGTPIRGPDHALNAFAQLVAFGLDVDRAIISLIDRSNQFIIAESTKSFSSQAEGSCSGADDLILGIGAIPRTNGLCECSLVKPTGGTLVVPNIQDDATLRAQDFTRSRPEIKFYAAKNVVSNGFNIGVLCVYDRKARDTLSNSDEMVLKDMSNATAQHLESLRAQRAHSKGLKLLETLDSFMIPQVSDAIIDVAQDTTDTEIDSAVPLDGAAMCRDHTAYQTPKDQSPSGSFSDNTEREPRRHESEPTVLDTPDILQRAANLLLDGFGAADGVVLLGTNRPGSRDSTTSPHQSNAVPNDDEYEELGTTERARGRRSYNTAQDQLPAGGRCKHLAQASRSSEAEVSASLRGKDLLKLLYQHPRGKVFHMEDRLGMADNASDSTIGQSRRPSLAQPHTDNCTNLLGLLSDVFPSACSIVFFPLWDSHRQEWFAGGFIYSSSLIFSAEDLRFLSAFSTCVMSDIARRDFLLAELQKETFISMISHELRSPLHGILANIELMRDCGLGPFQTTLLDTIDGCGHSLLDIINHLLDHTAMVSINDGRRQKTSTSRYIDKPHLQPDHEQDRANAKSRIQMEEDIDVVAVTEEIISGLTSALQLSANNREGYENCMEVSSIRRQDLSMSKAVMIYAIFPKDNWVMRLPIGAFRRILANLTGNAIKFTPSGTIEIALFRDSPKKGSATCNVALQVRDTGTGISKEFMDHHLWKQFRQEDPYTLGSGLGLFIVSQIVHELKGTVDIESEKGKGTTATVEFPCELVSHAPPTDGSRPVEYLANTLGRVKRDCKGVVIRFVAGAHDDKSQFLKSLEDSRKSISKVCKEWFNVKVEHVSTMESKPHTINMVDESYLFSKTFQELQTEIADLSHGRKRHSSSTIFIGGSRFVTDLHKDSTSKASKNLFFVTNPCGPHQLGRILSLCLEAMEEVSHIAIETTSAEQMSQPSPSVENKVILDRPPSPEETDLSIRTRMLPELGQHNNERSSQPDNGSAADLSTAKPLKASKSPEEATQIPISSAPESPTFTVMLVEDNTINMKILEAHAKKLKLDYDLAFDGSEAVKLFEQSPLRYDVIWMDIMMPIMRGTVATQHIRTIEEKVKRTGQKPPTHIVALTGLSGGEVESDATGCGMDEFFTKPIKRDVLQRSLEAWKEKRASFETRP